jgi:EAL domain-containing protein (putative c-di-GMP-specific phosphodiesterase class I)
MCEAMVSFTQKTGTMLVAEGVETENELAALRDLGVLYAQGFHLGRPTIPN